MVESLRSQARNTAWPQGGLHVIQKAGISKQWRHPTPVARRQPRGMRNPHNLCYRRSVMQMFLNSPIFLNWLQTHKRGGKSTSRRTGNCPADRNVECVACHFWALALAYWNHRGKYDETQFNAALDHFDQQFVNRQWTASFLARGDNTRDITTGQEDADEFRIFLVEALCIDPPTNSPHRLNPVSQPMPRPLWESLFSLSTRTTRACTACGHAVQTEVTHTSHQCYTTLGNGLTVQEYFDDSWAPDQVIAACGGCGVQNLPSSRITRITAAPHILFVTIQNFRFAQHAYKHDPAAQLSPVLDATQWQQVHPAPLLQYQLRHVIYHAGNTPTVGHYSGKYTGPSGPFSINDRKVVAVNSVADGLGRDDKKNGMRGCPYILMYEKM